MICTRKVASAFQLDGRSYTGGAVSTRNLAGIGAAGPLLFAVVVLVLDVVQYDYLVAAGDHPWTTSPVSVNALGSYGWIQIVNFGVLGMSVIALAIAAHRGIRGESDSIVGPAFIALWGIAFLFAMFPIERQPQSFSGYAHGIAFIVMSLTLIPMYLFMWRRLRHSPGWEAFARYTLIMGVFAFPLQIASVALQEIIPFSWIYLWLGAQFVWCMLLGARLSAGARVQESDLTVA